MQSDSRLVETRQRTAADKLLGGLTDLTERQC